MIDTAGTISADLSQVIGSKRKVNEKELNNSIVGGGLGDLLSINPQNVDGMIWSFNLPTELNNASNIYFDLVKVQTQANGDPMITEKGELIPEPVRLRFKPSTSNQIKFITPGCYFYDLWVEFSGDPPIRHPVVKRAEITVEASLADFS